MTLIFMQKRPQERCWVSLPKHMAYFSHPWASHVLYIRLVLYMEVGGGME